MAQNKGLNDIPYYICSMAKNRNERDFPELAIMPGVYMLILRDKPTMSIIRAKAGIVEPAHHHRSPHDRVVLKGKIRVTNLSGGGEYELGAGDCLYIPAMSVHRVEYLEDSELFAKWDEIWAVILDDRRN